MISVKFILHFINQLILGGEGAYAGDFSFISNGVFGDDIQQQTEMSSELIPLLKRAIALIQEKGLPASDDQLTSTVSADITMVNHKQPNRRTVPLHHDMLNVPSTDITRESE